MTPITRGPVFGRHTRRNKFPYRDALRGSPPHAAQLQLAWEHPQRERVQSERGWLRSSTGSTPTRVHKWMALLSTRYRFRNYVAVSLFLRLHPYLIELLLEAWLEINQGFGPDLPLVLELFQDPASDDVQLYLLIQSPRPVAENLELLLQLYERWWLQAVPRARGKVTLSVEHM